MAGGGEAHGTKAIMAAFFANLGIAIMKFIGFLITKSGSMLAESVHSVADSGNQFLLLTGHRKARREADEVHQFGYGRERFFWAFVVALVLFTVGALFSILDGIEKLRHPHEIKSVGVAIAILVGAIGLELLSFRTAIHAARPLKGDAGWWRFIRTSKNPEIPVVLLEDLAALIGLMLALGAVGMAEITGNPDWDAIGTLAIGALLAVVAVILAIEMRSLLIGESASPYMQQRIIDTIESQPAVRKLISLRTEHIGPDSVLVAAKIEFGPDLTITQLADVVNEVEAAVRGAVPEAKVMYLEPDVFRSAASTASS